MLARYLVYAVSLLLISFAVNAEQIGSVRTIFNLVGGATDRVVVEVFDDPVIPGVACYLSWAAKGGISSSLGLDEDAADVAIDCSQTGIIVLPEQVENGQRDGEEVFKKNEATVFKSLQVLRFYDVKRNTLVYLSYTNKLVNGEIKNNISTVPVREWP